MRNSVTIYFLVFILFSCSKEETTSCQDTNCADYSSQAAAQVDFDADPACRNDLDADSDGLACEDFFNSSNPKGDCPNTSNCGCSNKRKAECNTSCCAWVVDDGCKCR